MGDKPSAGTQSTFSNSSTNSTNTSGPNPFIVPGLQNLATNAMGWIDKNMTAPAYFPNGTVAPSSPQTSSAIAGLAQRGAAGLGYGIPGASRQQLMDTISGKYLDPSSNPAFQSYLEASFRPQTEQLMTQILPGIDSKFAGSGRTAGGAHFDTTMRGVNDLDRAQADASSKAGLGLYQGERANQFSALGMLPQFQAMDYQDLAAQMQAGAASDADYQKRLDAQNAKYSYDTTAQPDWYARLSQLLQGMYPGGQTQGNSNTSSTGTGTGAGGGGGIGSFLGPGLSLLGTALPFIPGISDERAKDVMGRVGFTDEGLPLYLYKYKWEGEGDSPRIGPMAQEVAQVKPDAVFEHPSGFLAVDYAKATPAGGLF